MSTLLAKPVFPKLLDREDIIKYIVQKEEDSQYKPSPPFKPIRVEIPKVKRSAGMWNFIRGVMP